MLRDRLSNALTRPLSRGNTPVKSRYGTSANSSSPIPQRSVHSPVPVSGSAPKTVNTGVISGNTNNSIANDDYDSDCLSENSGAADADDFSDWDEESDDELNASSNSVSTLLPADGEISGAIAEMNKLLSSIASV